MQQFLSLLMMAWALSYGLVAVNAQSYAPGTGQKAEYQPIRQAYQETGPGDKLITVADLDGAFLKSIEVSANAEGLRTIRIVYQDENNQEGTLIYTERTGGELAGALDRTLGTGWRTGGGSGGGGSAPTNLSTSPAASSVVIRSSTGTDATIPAATTSQAGVMTSADRTKLNGISANAIAAAQATTIADARAQLRFTNAEKSKLSQILVSRQLPSGGSTGQILTKQSGTDFDVTWLDAPEGGGDGTTNLSVTRTSDDVTVGSSTGRSAVITAATTTQAGVMSAADKSKLNGIETGATADQTGAEMVTALSGLSGSARLPASAVRDLPTGGGGDTDGTPARTERLLFANLTNIGNTPVALTTRATGFSQVVFPAGQTTTELVTATASATSFAVAKAGTYLLDLTGLVQRGNPDNNRVNFQGDIRDASNAVVGRISGFYQRTVPNAGIDEVLVGYLTTTADNSAVTVRLFTPTSPSGSGSATSAVNFSNVALNITPLLNVEGTGGGGTAAPTNLSIQRTSNNVVIESSTGTNATIPPATSSLAGTMSASDKATLSATLSRTAVAQVAAGAASSRFTDAEKSKLNGIETGATADQTGAEMVAALSGLAGSARLPASAVRDLPTGGSGADATARAATVVNRDSINAMRPRIADNSREFLIIPNEWVRTTDARSFVLHLDAGAFPSGATQIQVTIHGVNVNRQALTADDTDYTIAINASNAGTIARAIRSTTTVLKVEVHYQNASAVTLAEHDFLIPVVSAATPGGITAAERTKLSGIESGAIGPAAATAIANARAAARFTDAEKTKLNGVESGATADQTGTEIVGLLEGLSGNARLQASAIRDLPSGGGSGEDATARAAAQVNLDSINAMRPRVTANSRDFLMSPNEWIAGSTGIQLYRLHLDDTAIPTGATQIQILFQGITFGRRPIVASDTDYLITINSGNTARIETAISGLTALRVEVRFDNALGQALARHDFLIPILSELTARPGYTFAERMKLQGVEAGATADQTGAEMVTALSALSGNDRLPASAVRDLPSGGGSGGGAVLQDVVEFPTTVSRLEFTENPDATYGTAGSTHRERYTEINGKTFVFTGTTTKTVFLADLIFINSEGVRDDVAGSVFYVMNYGNSGNVTFGGGGIADIRPTTAQGGATILPGYGAFIFLNPHQSTRFFLQVVAWNRDFLPESPETLIGTPTSDVTYTNDAWNLMSGSVRAISSADDRKTLELSLLGDGGIWVSAYFPADLFRNAGNITSGGTSTTNAIALTFPAAETGFDISDSGRETVYMGRVNNAWYIASSALSNYARHRVRLRP